MTCPVAFHAKRVSDAGDVVEEANDLHRIVDGAVVEAVRTQQIEVGGAHLLLGKGELGGKFAERTVSGGKWRRTPIRGDGVNQCVGFRDVLWIVSFDLSTEIVSVRLRSVDATQLRRNHRCQHLSLKTAERTFGKEQRTVDADHTAQC